MSDELKVCPFCGGSAVYDEPYPNQHVITCNLCQCNSGLHISRKYAEIEWSARHNEKLRIELREAVENAERYDTGGYLNEKEVLQAIDEVLKG